MDGYSCSRAWFKYAAENSDKVRSQHTALYFYIVELFNYRRWPEVVGLPTDYTIGILNINYKTYKRVLDDLVQFGFVKMVEESKNQYTSNKVALVDFTEASTEASTNSLPKHLPTQSQSNGQSTVSIIKQLNILNKETIVTLNIFDIATTLKNEFEFAELIKIKLALDTIFSKSETNTPGGADESTEATTPIDTFDRSQLEPFFKPDGKASGSITDIKENLRESPLHIKNLLDICQKIDKRITGERLGKFISAFFDTASAKDTVWQYSEIRSYLLNYINKEAYKFKEQNTKLK